jgi:hypothetical protein
MEPAMAQFESKFKNKVNLVTINVDQDKTAEYKKYGYLAQKAAGIPYTVWIDSKRKILSEETGQMDVKQLSDRTTGAIKKAR